MSDAEAELLELLRTYGDDAVSFQALEAGLRRWCDAPPPVGTGAVVAYCDTGRGWVAVGKPLVARAGLARAATRFIAAARRVGRRASFFATESPVELGCAALHLGQQPIFRPREWEDMLARQPRLREQLRRARAKGLQVYRVAPLDLAPGSPLRRKVEQLSESWLASRRMDPMGFLVAVEPFHAPEEHRYFIAERGGQVVAFLSAVPIFARHGWLVEDVLRGALRANVSETPAGSGISVVEGEVDEDIDVGIYQAKRGGVTGHDQEAAAAVGEAGPGGGAASAAIGGGRASAAAAVLGRVQAAHPG